VPLFATAAGLLVLALGDESLDEATRRVDAALAVAAVAAAGLSDRPTEQKAADDAVKVAESEAEHVARRMVPDMTKVSSGSAAAVVALPRALYDSNDRDEDEDDGVGMSIDDASSIGDNSLPSITSHRQDKDRAQKEKDSETLPKDGGVTPSQKKGAANQKYPQVTFFAPAPGGGLVIVTLQGRVPLRHR